MNWDLLRSPFVGVEGVLTTAAVDDGDVMIDEVGGLELEFGTD